MYKLDPDTAGPPPRDLSALNRSRARDADMIEIAQPCLEQLFGLLADTDCCVILADRDGVMVDLRTNRALDAWQRPPQEWPGTNFAEEQFGTNSIGTCLAEKRSVIVRGEQHFLTCFTQRVGISTPIFGPDGDLVGALQLNQCADAHDARLDSFLSISLSNFARRIETELFARAHPATRLVFASPHGLRPDALLAIDPDDRVIGATRGARRLLELGDRLIARAPYVNEITPHSMTGDGDALAEIERRAIVRALARCGGNHSAAAKAVGISRSTLYRKLKSYESPVPMVAPPPALKPRSSA